jgi:CubicO group peptidase (beta-lactamase class C family)
MRLVEQGKLALDTDVSRYLGYTLRNPYYPDAAITLRMLLSHTSSLRDDGGYNFPASTSLQSVMQASEKTQHQH